MFHIKFTHAKCTVQWFLISEHFNHSLKFLCSFAVNPCSKFQAVAKPEPGIHLPHLGPQLAAGIGLSIHSSGRYYFHQEGHWAWVLSLLQIGWTPFLRSTACPLPWQNPWLLSWRGWENDGSSPRQECPGLPLFLLEVQLFNQNSFTCYCLQLFRRRGFADVLILSQLEISPTYIHLTAFFKNFYFFLVSFSMMSIASGLGLCAL